MYAVVWQLFNWSMWALAYPVVFECQTCHKLQDAWPRSEAANKRLCGECLVALKPHPFAGEI